jgi:hypothetical protein
MNITLSADPELVKKVREYAARKGTTLNRLIREYMEQVIGEKDADSAAAEFARLAREEAGQSPEGFRFNRDAAHQR